MLKMVGESIVFKNLNPIHQSLCAIFPCLVKLPDGELLCLFRVGQARASYDGRLELARSADGGKTWSLPEEVNFVGELSRPIELENGQILCVYNDRKKPAGIKAVFSSSRGASWNTTETSTIWDAAELAGKNNPFADFLAFDFGMPSVQQLPDGTIAVAFYAYENHVCHIRLRRFIVEGT